MGTRLWGFGHKNARRLFKQDYDDRNVGLATSIIKFVKRKCQWTTKKQRKRQLYTQEKKHLFKSTGQLVTLEEWILSSPGLSVSFTSAEGEFHVSKQASQRIHPSLDRNRVDFSSKSTKTFNMEKLDGEREEFEDASLCRSQSGKLKKKVSFRLPIVADIFLLDSPEAHFENFGK